MKAVLKCSICTGEQVAGFKDIETGKFTEVCLINSGTDLDLFMEKYNLAAISKEY
ncbi:MAG: aspartate dehydrogenase [Lachnospira sp.]|nr:aspartate dehydrogenase [Lachnospira sp.]